MCVGARPQSPSENGSVGGKATLAGIGANCRNPLVFVETPQNPFGRWDA